MPQRTAVDIGHAAVTDHRILKRPAQQISSLAAQVLSVWHAPRAEIAERNLGLAFFHLARRNNSGVDYQRAYNILSKQPHQKDPEVATALGYMLLGTGNPKASVSLFEQAANCQSSSSESWLDLGVAQQTTGDIQSAISSFSHSMELAPYDYRPYKALADLYSATHQPQKSHEVLRRFVELVPQSIVIRSIP
jgi:tetratricopeptide (TPR) repeat protein